MTRIEVHKFGGTSLADAQRYQNAASLISSVGPGVQVVAVVSAMGKTTDELVDAAAAAEASERTQALAVIETVRARHGTVLTILDAKEPEMAGRGGPAGRAHSPDQGPDFGLR